LKEKEVARMKKISTTWKRRRNKATLELAE